jgi:hypothetical protein
MKLNGELREEQRRRSLGRWPGRERARLPACGSHRHPARPWTTELICEQDLVNPADKDSALRMPRWTTHIYVSDLERSIDFYTSLSAFSIVRESADT